MAGVNQRVEVSGLNETLRAFNAYGKNANKELRAAAGAEVNRIVPAIVLAAGATSPTAVLVGPSVRRRSDRVPVIQVGGSRRVRPRTRPGRRVTAGDLVFGSEFGGGRNPTTHQFAPWVGRRGRWFWPTVRAHLPELRRRYIDALDDLAAKWARGGDLPDV